MSSVVDGPISTCTRDDCEDCPVEGRVTCHFTWRDRAVFSASAAPAFVLAFAGLYLVGPLLVAVMAALTVAYFGLVEVWSMCSHCPHYAEPGTRTLRCWANHGCPKLREHRPGPMSGPEKSVFMGGMATVMGFPALVFLAQGMTPLLAAYCAALVLLFTVLRLRFCGRCMNLACPLNRVDAGTAGTFRELNPGA